MNTKIFKALSLVAISMLTFSACEKENGTDPKVPDSGKTVALIQTSINNDKGDSGKSYIQVVNYEKAGSYDNANALPTGWGNVPIVKSGDIFALPDYLGASKSVVTRYSLGKQNTLMKEGELEIPGQSTPANILEISKDKAYIAFQYPGKVWIFNPQTMKKVKELDLSSYASSQCVAAPGIMIARDNYIYIPLNNFNGTTYMPTEKRILIAIFNTQTDELVKLIDDKDTELSFPSRPIVPGSVFMDENHDIYMICMGAFGFAPNFPAGIIRLKNGETEVDKSYDFNLSKIEIKGLEYKGSYICNEQYIGNGKMIAGIVVNGLQKPNEKSPFSAHIVTYCIVDLKNKTIEQIPNIPLSSPQVGPIGLVGDVAFLPVDGINQTAFIPYNIKTGKVEKNVISVEGTPNSFIVLNK